MHVLADEAEGLRRGEGDVATDLRLDDLLGAEAEGSGIGVAGLLFEGIPADGAAVEAGRRAGLEAAGAQAEGAQCFAEQDAGGLAAAAGGIALFAAVDEAVEEGAGGDDGGAGKEVAAVAELEAEDAATGADGREDTIPSIHQASIGLMFPVGCSLFRSSMTRSTTSAWRMWRPGWDFENLAHLDAVELLVALGARAPDGGAAGGVEQAELDADGVGDFAHDAAESVDFADQMALGDAADGGVAAHLGDEVEVHGDERGLEAHARGGHGGLAAGVARAHHGDIVLFGKSHPILFYGLEPEIEIRGREYVSTSSAGGFRVVALPKTSLTATDEYQLP